MYIKPDFVRVSVKVKDVFSNYLQTGCINDEGNYRFVLEDISICRDKYLTFPTEQWGVGCYSTFNP